MKFTITATITAILLILFTSCGLHAQREYKMLWVEVDNLNNKGLPQSALEKTDQIYKLADEQGETTHLIRALLMRIKLRSDYQEHFLETSIAELRAEINGKPEPARQIMHSILAELYWRYYTANRGLFLNRTYTITNDSDISTWDLKKLVHETSLNYDRSLENPDLLKDIALTDYNFILLLKEGSKKFRPTIYDLLAHRAVDFYMNEEKSVAQPAERFEIDDPVYFSKAKDFSKLDIVTKDKSSFSAKTLVLLRDLIDFHLRDKDPAALIDVDLKRLRYVYGLYTGEDKDERYKNVLKDLILENEKDPSSTEASFELAKLYVNLGQQYDAFQQKQYQWNYKNAKIIIDKAINTFPDSRGARNCSTLLPTLDAKELAIRLNYANVEGKKSLAFLRYRNVKKVYLRVLKMDAGLDQDLRQQRSNEKLIQTYLSIEPDTSWNISPPNVYDFQSHSIEFPIPELEKGYYVLLTSDNEEFSGSGLISHVHFWSTNLSFISKNTEVGKIDLYVLNRDNGMAVEGARIDVFMRKYDYGARKYLMNNIDLLTTDKHGYATMEHSGSKAQSLYFRFSSQADTFMTENFFYLRDPRPDRDPLIKTYFFTDRAIYRPGQTVYFKGIVVEGKENNYKIRMDEKTTVGLYDVNGKRIREMEMTSGEYGSFQGSFMLPESALTGQFRISNGKGNVYFSVEEYKRPTFQVNINPLKGSYRLNEEIEITGMVSSYSGNPVDNADIKYRVIRKTWFPRWYWPIPHGQEQAITNGSTTSDTDGNYTFNFKAIPDFKADKHYRPVFYYTIFIDVTDITGETQTTQKTIAVGYKSTIVNIEIPEIISKRQTNTSFDVSTTNLNGEKVRANLNVAVYRLEAPKNILRSRPWPQPDTFLLKEKDFKNQFPGDVYRNEDEMTTWKHDELIMELKLITPRDSLLSLGEINKWDDGPYVLIIKTTDRYSEEITVEKYFRLYDEKKNRMPGPMAEFFINDRETVQPGENVVIHLGTSYSDVQLLYELSNDRRVFKKEWLEIDNETTEITIPVLEEYRGGVTAEFTWIKENRSYQKMLHLIVPFNNKKLNIAFTTFRSELQPGDTEEWEVKITNPDGSVAAAELLASMYDASLESFRPHNWEFSLYRFLRYGQPWIARNAFSQASSSMLSKIPPSVFKPPVTQEYDQLNWFGYSFYGYGYPMLNRNSMFRDELKMAAPGLATQAEGEIMDDGEEPSNISGQPEEKPEISPEKEMKDMPVRRNFQETAFFYPNLKTDENGSVIINFTIPESLTEWRFMGLAYDQELRSSIISKNLVTRKQLMVVPNYPRFLRHGDTISFTVKVVSMIDEYQEGVATLELINPLNEQKIEDHPGLETSPKAFSVQAGESAVISWNISIPQGIDVLKFRVKASAGNYTDGEEKSIPVLPSRMMVTETLPLPVRGAGTTNFNFDHLENSADSPTLDPFLLTLEFTSNPAWYAVRALPYLMDPKYKSAEAIFNQYYANSLSSFIANSDPAIAAVFEAWKRGGEESFMSQLEKNEELKNIVLNETPWVMDASSESDNMQRIAILFDRNRLEYESVQALRKLRSMQSQGGGWPWFNGMRDNRLVTQRIVTGVGKLHHMGVISLSSAQQVVSMMNSAIKYLDEEIQNDFDKLEDKNGDHLNSLQINYLYAKSFFRELKLTRGETSEAYTYYLNQARDHWKAKAIYEQGMIALVLHRAGFDDVANSIVASLKEHSLTDPEMGMYWRELAGYYWNQAPVERQALMIEVFDEVTGDSRAIEDLKVWLLKQKQTQSWKTNRATADAVYALLMKGTDLLSDDELVDVTMGYEKIDPLALEGVNVEAGTGYFKTSWKGQEISPDMGNITVSKKTEGVAWGAVYFQYFEDMDKIISAETPLSLEKKLFVKVNTPEGQELREIEDGQEIKTGDEVISRIIIRVDRNMEYVHLKDMRAAAFEPAVQLSGYKYTGGLGYYESPGDVATDFFMDYLRKGTYVIEYPVYATQEGSFINGISTIQCLYAPEFSAHSEGLRVTVER